MKGDGEPPFTFNPYKNGSFSKGSILAFFQAVNSLKEGAAGNPQRLCAWRDEKEREKNQSRGPMELKSGANTRDTTVISLIRMLMEGPEVSLKGSPTVSPTTADLWAEEPLPP